MTEEQIPKKMPPNTYILAKPQAEAVYDEHCAEIDRLKKELAEAQALCDGCKCVATLKEVICRLKAELAEEKAPTVYHDVEEFYDEPQAEPTLHELQNDPAEDIWDEPQAEINRLEKENQ